MRGGAIAAADPLAYAAIIEAPFRRVRLGVRLDAGALSCIDFLAARPDGRAAGAGPPARRGAAAVTRQLEAYFRDPARRFDLPLAPRGTEFQRRVWRALTEIPPGETRRYGELAARLGTSARAVGAACRANPVPIVIPCHRVVAAGGTGGYAGTRAGPLMEFKRWLLAHEGGASE